TLRIFALERGDGTADIVGSRLTERGDAHVAEARIERRVRDAADIDLGAAEREIEWLGRAFTTHRELHAATGRTTPLRDGTRLIRPHFLVVDLHDDVAREEPGLFGGRTLDGSQNLHAGFFGHDLDAHAGIRAHRGQTDLFELIGIEIGGMRIERRDHAA